MSTYEAAIDRSGAPAALAGKPILQQLNAQHALQYAGDATAAGLGVERFDQPQQACPRHDLIHLGKQALATGLLALAGVFEVGNAYLAHLAHGGSDQVVMRLSHTLDLYEESLNPRRYLPIKESR